jgi:hypothetical protein
LFLCGHPGIQAITGRHGWILGERRRKGNPVLASKAGGWLDFSGSGGKDAAVISRN